MDSILLEITDSIATVTINRPQTMNALSMDVLDELYQIFSIIDNEPSIVAAIITGAGNKAFAAGTDITAFISMTGEDGRALGLKGQTVCDKIDHCRVPVIAAVNGWAFGGGCEVTLSADIRIASENAMFGQQEILWGILPGWGGTQRLPRVIHRSDAMKIILTGEPINAQEAYRIGLVSGVYPQDELMDQAYKMARKIVQNGPNNVINAKRVVVEGANSITTAALALENEYLVAGFASGEPRKRVEKFLARKKG